MSEKTCDVICMARLEVLDIIEELGAVATHLREAYNDFEMGNDRVAKMRERLGDVSIMKDRRGGTTRPLTLQMLRERIESGKSFDRHAWGGCGCSLDIEPNVKIHPHEGRE